MTSRFSLTLITLITGMLTGVAPGQAQVTLPATSIAQASAPPASVGLNRQPSRNYVLIYVNAIAGSDATGDGTQMSPLKTITQALQNATPNTVIVLAPGEYSEATGETFPLQLKAGVTVQGMPGPSRNTVVIRGNGSYLSPSRGLENSAIVAVDRSGLGNVMVMNPHAQGTGVWIETGSPVLRDNVFAGSGRAGVYVAGAGTPVIQRNYFTENGSAGLIIDGPSQAQVQGNVFEKTGIGIQVSPGAEPRILENRVVQNQDGIILQANARPILENNVISGNRRNGLVEFQASAENQVLSTTAPSSEEPTLLPSSTPLTSPTLISSAINSSASASIEALPPVAPTNQTTTSVTAVTAAPPATTQSEAAVVTRDSSIETEPPRSAEPEGVVATENTASSAVEDLSNEPPSRGVMPETQEALPQIPVEMTTTTPIPSTSLTSQASAKPPSENSTEAAEPSEETAVAELPSVAPDVAAPASTPEVSPAVSLPSLGSPQGEPIVASNPATSSLIAALRQRVLANRQNQSLASTLPSASSTTTDPNAVELPVIPPSAPSTGTSSETANTSPEQTSQQRDLASIRARILANRASASTSPSEAAAVAASSSVTPPPVTEVARANTAAPPAAAESLPLIPTEGNLPTAPSANLPSLPRPEPSSDLLQVPGPNIPVGSGGSMPEILLVNTGTAVGGPPSLPSRAVALGLRYKVFVNAPDEATQNRVKIAVPDAFRVRVDGQVMMQAGAFPDQATADAIANNLAQQGLEARVEYVE
ncbi:MAG TPA: DUF1565 domain-containing protein [Leptolyngbyaceae cyanobacterium]